MLQIAGDFSWKTAGKECTKTVLKLGMHLSYTVYLNSFPFGLEQNIYINSFLTKQIEARHPWLV